MELIEKLKKLPDTYGVYIMRDKGNNVIYVGKAVSLKKRVKSYFASSGNISPKITSLVSNIYMLEYIVAESEKEALLIEYALIKKCHPRYNVDYKDDKKYPFIKLTLNEDFPRLIITRNVTKDGSKYYGPYPDGTSLRSTIRRIRKIFPLRTCKKPKLPDQVCLDYHIKRCLGPCIGKVKKESYGSIVKEVNLFLKGQHRRLLSVLENKMAKASKSLNFEEATRLRNEISGIKKLTEKINLKQIPKEIIFDQFYKKENISDQLKDVLILEKSPTRIEGFDVSNISGKEAVGAVVVFINGEPFRNEYRRFKIKTVNKIDDCAMIKEIVKRRYTRMIQEKRMLPDLILIDGGKTQLNAAQQALEDLEISNLDVISLAKNFEHIFVPSQKTSVILEKNSEILHFLQHIRDEAHRFAVRYHRHLRGKIK